MFDLKTHKIILLQILKEIYTDTSLGPLLGFKGGTAGYLFYDLGRFSVDLDFDLLDEKQSHLVFGKIGEILDKFGRVKDKREKRNTLFFILSYSEKARNIKVEISQRNFGSSFELKNYLGISMLVMVKKDMLANKLVAMLERKNIAHRDIYDVWFFMKNNWPVNEGIIKKRTGLSLKDYLKKCLSFLESLSDKNILAGMGELLDDKTKIWVKKNLRTDFIFLIKLRLKEE